MFIFNKMLNISKGYGIKGLWASLPCQRCLLTSKIKVLQAGPESLCGSFDLLYHTEQNKLRSGSAPARCCQGEQRSTECSPGAYAQRGIIPALALASPAGMCIFWMEYAKGRD